MKYQLLIAGLALQTVSVLATPAPEPVPNDTKEVSELKEGAVAAAKVVEGEATASFVMDSAGGIIAAAPDPSVRGITASVTVPTRHWVGVATDMLLLSSRLGSLEH